MLECFLPDLTPGYNAIRLAKTPPRHCGRSEAIQSSLKEGWIASSQVLLAMTVMGRCA
jgi:hypothetical protein